MADLTWTIDTGRSDGGIVSNGVINDNDIPTTPDLKRAKRVDLTFGFWDDASITTDHVTRYKNFRQYGDYAGSANVQQSIVGTPLITERVPQSAAVDSIILDLVPGADVDETPGVWAVITDMTDQTRLPADMARIDVSIKILAELSEYADRQALKDDMGGNLP